MKSEFCKRNLHTAGELLARVLEAATRIRRRDQLRKIARDIGTGVAKCIQVDGMVFRTFILNFNESVISVQQICLLNNQLKLI
jgi:hypothetical protein